LSLINNILSKWFVPRSQHDSIQKLARTYAKQLEDYERAVETKKLFAKKIDYLGRLLLDEGFSPSDIETDEFYTKLESQINYIRRARSEIGYRLARVGTNFLYVEVESPPYVTDTEYTKIEKSAYDLQRERLQYREAIREIGAIALQDEEFEDPPSAITKEEIDRILIAIADLRRQIANLKEENTNLKDRGQNHIKSLQLSQKEVQRLEGERSCQLLRLDELSLSQKEVQRLEGEVTDLRAQGEALKEVAKGYAHELTDLRREKIELISRASVIANKVRDDMDRLVNSRLPLT
jgi:hypothetical protein